MISKAIAFALLLLVALAHFGPEHIAPAIGASETAVEYVLRGVQGFALFTAVAILAQTRLVALACGWGGVETAAQPMCRLAFPMDRPPPVPRDVGLCTAAYGESAGLLGLMLALAIVTVFALVAFNPSARS